MQYKVLAFIERRRVRSCACVFVVKLDCLCAFWCSQTSGALCSSGGRQEGSLLSHFFIITSVALLHLSPLEVKKVTKGSESDSSFASSLSKFPFPLLNLLQTLAPSAQKPLFFRGAKKLSCWSRWRCSLASVDISAKWRMLCHSLNSSVTLFLPLRARQPFIFLQLPKNLPSSTLRPACRINPALTWTCCLADHREGSPVAPWLESRPKSRIRRRVQASWRAGLGWMGEECWTLALWQIKCRIMMK